MRRPDSSILRLTELLIRTLISRETDYEIIADGILDVICMLIRKNMQDTVRYPFVDALKTVIYNNISNPDFNLHTAIAQSVPGPIQTTPISITSSFKLIFHLLSTERRYPL